MIRAESLFTLYIKLKPYLRAVPLGTCSRDPRDGYVLDLRPEDYAFKHSLRHGVAIVWDPRITDHPEPTFLEFIDTFFGRRKEALL